MADTELRFQNKTAQAFFRNRVVIPKTMDSANADVSPQNIRTRWPPLKITDKLIFDLYSCDIAAKPLYDVPNYGGNSSISRNRSSFRRPIWRLSGFLNIHSYNLRELRN